MSTAAPPTPSTALPCRADPDRWFDRRERTHALAACLACPARSWCAREALATQPAWGMWAGIWIDGNLGDVEHYLAAIAGDAPAPTTPPPAALTRRVERPLCSPVIRRPAKDSVAAAITARSSGHCEIMAPDCSLGLDAIDSRIRGRSPVELRDAADGYAVCRRCRTVVQRMERRLAHSLGFLVDQHDDPTTAPFHWRRTHWMLLDPVGGAVPCEAAVRTA